MWTNEERAKVGLELAGLCSFYQRPPLPDTVLRWYVQDLQHVPVHEVLGALTTLRRQPKRRTMPLPAEVLALVRPSDTTQDPAAAANALAGKIVKAVSTYGYMRGREARAHLGEVGWQVVEAKGGWREICQSLNANDNSFFAQCRDLAAGFLAMRTAAQQPQKAPLASPVAEKQLENALRGSQAALPGGISSAGDVLRKVLDRDAGKATK